MFCYFLKTAAGPVAVAAVLALCACSFLAGYSVGYLAAWQDAYKVDVSKYLLERRSSTGVVTPKLLDQTAP